MHFLSTWQEGMIEISYQVLIKFFIKVSLHDVSRMYCNTEVFVHVVEESTFLMKDNVKFGSHM